MAEEETLAVQRAAHGRRQDATEVVVALAALNRLSLPVAGGKAANLGELMRAGLPVPDGFCLTTKAYAAVAAGAGLQPILETVAATPAADTARLAELAAAARAALLAAPVPEAITAAIVATYRTLAGPGADAAGQAAPAPDGAPVAVRSSATAEDLPGASFAGQQETYLNVVESEAVLDAVRRCWASLWTDRAVTYRAANGIDQRSVRLAVVVQRMVDARVAGVLFTANPLTGRRRQAVIDASPGLGEAVVSGAANPDHFVVDTDSGQVLERSLGDKRVRFEALPGGGTRRRDLPAGAAPAQPCLADAELRALAQLGARVERHFGAPQDVEWALDAGSGGAAGGTRSGPAGGFWLTQARPITTLFPLPANAPDSKHDLRVYFNGNVAQGVYRPITPMGMQGFRLFGSALATVFGHAPRDVTAGPGAVAEAAHRPFLDVTPLVRSNIGRRVARVALGNIEARTGPLLQALEADPRLAPRRTPLWRLARALLPVLIRARLPVRIAQALRDPAAARREVARAAAAARACGDVADDASALQRLAAVERVLLEGAPHIVRGMLPVFPIGLASFALAWRLLGDLATPAEKQTVLRGLPHNPTTEMDLQLWALAQRARADGAAAAAIRTRPPAELAADYRRGALPVALQRPLADFLRAFGHRGVAEIDLGLPRWADDPSHVLGVLANYLRLEDQALAPDVQFRRAAAEAEAMVDELARRAARRQRLRGALVRFCLRRTRELAGLREAPKFHLVALLARARALLQPVGERLAASGRIESADDIYFLDLAEARVALAGADLRPVVRERRASYDRELQRRHLPRVLLSDGTEPGAAGWAPYAGRTPPGADLPLPGAAAAAPARDSALRGTPASAGVVTARARVILDPHGARLEPGEILVAPSTDPGWTPLFLTASGLVMEMGGPMSHGAVVAREYGIPAVVGVPAATEVIRTGQQITVDGSSGLVTPAAN